MFRCLCGYDGLCPCTHTVALLAALVIVVKRAKQVRRCAQVLLDCRWFVKRFTDQRMEMLEDIRDEEHIRVTSTLGAHLKLQVCIPSSRPDDVPLLLSPVPADY